MTLDLDDTIAAIATAPGGGLRGIVRLSGPGCLAVVEQVVRLEESAIAADVRVPSCRRGSVTLPRGLGRTPLTLYLWPTTSSYTRQPSAELHLPGSPPLVAAALEVVCKAGARLAQPGEFTLRAFLAGRLDLTQAEAVLGVIEAESRPQLDAALAQLAGGLAQPLAALRNELLDMLAELEAGLDFAEEDIEFISKTQIERQLAAAAKSVRALAEQMQRRGESGPLPRVVLVGRPNVGKSSLLNALASDGAAIVSPTAGTTRDFVTRRVSLGQRECLLIDTAGMSPLDEARGLDAAAQAASRQQAQQAELTLLCLDASRPLGAGEAEKLAALSNQRHLVVWTKCDLPRACRSDGSAGAVFTSSRGRAGLDELRQAILQALDAAPAECGVVAGTADRCRESLRLAGEAIKQAQFAASEPAGEELVAAELRVALEELGRVAGAVYTDDILDRIFSRFCIGK
jgi:tRNA modification GTPase